jgi:hypothetical protein
MTAELTAWVLQIVETWGYVGIAFLVALENRTPTVLPGCRSPFFTLYTAVGNAIWNGVLIGAGWALDEHWEKATRYTKLFEYAIIALLALLVGHFIWRRWRGGTGEAPTRPGRPAGNQPTNTHESSRDFRFGMVHFRHLSSVRWRMPLPIA